MDERRSGASSRRSAAEVSHRARGFKNPRRPTNRNRSPEGEIRRSRDRSRSPPKREAKKKLDDYAKLIPNYQSMTPAERVRAKMDFQLSRTAERDKSRGSSAGGWERFKFSNDAPLDEHVATDNPEDIAANQADEEEGSFSGLGRSFFSHASQATREKHTEAAHDAAMFGVPVRTAEESSESPADQSPGRNTDEPQLSEQVMAMQNETWQQRARRLQACKDARM